MKAFFLVVRRRLAVSPVVTKIRLRCTAIYKNVSVGGSDACTPGASQFFHPAPDGIAHEVQRGRPFRELRRAVEIALDAQQADVIVRSGLWSHLLQSRGQHRGAPEMVAQAERIAEPDNGIVRGLLSMSRVAGRSRAHMNDEGSRPMLHFRVSGEHGKDGGPLMNASVRVGELHFAVPSVNAVLLVLGEFVRIELELVLAERGIKQFRRGKASLDTTTVL
jgi:hypothetical protein